MVSILFFVFAFFAEVAGTMAGFGSSTLFLPLALLFFDFKTALLLVAIFHISGNLGRLTFFRHGLDRNLLLRFGIPSVIATVIGALLVNLIVQDVLKLVLGIFLLAYVFFAWHGQRSFKPTKQNSLIGASLSGFFAGLIGTGGALRGAFLSAFKLKKSVYLATAAAISLSGDLMRIPIYFGSGFLSPNLYYLIPILFVIAIFASFTGKKVVTKIPQKTFRKWVLFAIALASLTFIYSGMRAVLLF